MPGPWHTHRLASHGVRGICTSTSHFCTLFFRVAASGSFQPEAIIRLMVDVLLTMNESLCLAEGEVFLRRLPPTQGMARR